MDNLDNNNKPKFNKVAILTLVGLALLFAGIIAFYFTDITTMSEKPIYAYMVGAIAALVVIIGIVFAVMVKMGKIPQREPDYRTFFILGVIWMPFGIATDNSIFWMMGLVFIIVGLANRRKWKNHKKLSEMRPGQRNFILATLIILGLLVLFGFIAGYLMAR